MPIRWLEGAKSRLGEALDAEERRDLVTELLGRTLDALRAADGIDLVVVVSPDEDALDLARAAGAIGLRQLGGGLNDALDQARLVAIELGAARLVVIPGDLPTLDAGAIEDVLAAEHAPDGASSVVLVPDRHGAGTNALVLVPPDVIAFAFGERSRSAHAALARAAGARYAEVAGPLDLDLDTPEDLLVAGDAGPGHGAETGHGAEAGR